MTSLDEKQAELKRILSEMGSVLIAYSGGVDSTLLLWAALDALGQQHVLAVTGSAPIFPRSELEAAQALAHDLGADHRFLPTQQLDNKLFVQNPPQRCYVCKQGILAQLIELARQEELDWVIEGSNVDDRSAHRPGRRAIEESNVRSPLEEAGLTKAEIRALSRRLDLPTWDKPASPCLVTRFPYGDRITRDGLARVEAAENVLREEGFRELRVRDDFPTARIEVAAADMIRLTQADTAARMVRKLKAAGYGRVTLDLEGYRSGSLDEKLAVDTNS